MEKAKQDIQEMEIKDKLEDHSHTCIDELCGRGIASLRFIEAEWRQHDLRCDTIKSATGRNAFVYAILQLEEMTKEVDILCHGD